MSVSNQGTQQRFPYKYGDVFDALLAVLPQIKMKLKSSDKILGRVNVTTSASGFSWGEDITITLEQTGEATTVLGIDSYLKVAENTFGAGKHRKNFESIISALSQRLQK